MQPNTRRRAIIRNGVVAGSVWETRMKIDEVKGGIKVFNDARESRDDEDGLRVYQKLRRNQSEGAGTEKRKRMSWKQPEPQKSPIQGRKERSSEVGCKKRVLLICNGPGNQEEVGKEEDDDDEKIEVEVEEKMNSFDDKEIDLPVEKEKKMEEVKKTEKIHEIQSSPPPMVVVQNKVSYVKDLKEKDPDSVKDLKEKDPDSVPQPQGDEEDEVLFEDISRTSDRMQHIVDLVMWRDLSKSAFAFGFGTFFLLSFSYAKDLNFSLITVVSYLGFLYLAVIFVSRSILRRGAEAVEFQEGDRGYLVGEEDAIWIIRKVLPYLNELILSIRALFSGDPATTMKMAVLLFVMARCGSSITMWTLAKLVFFGVFTIPKFLSSYSVQLARYGQFWLARFRDGWESCTHKKAMVAAVFTLIWNLSSTIARIWAVFMLVVAIRLYQQCMVVTWDEEEEVTIEQTQQQQQQHIKRVPRLVEGSRDNVKVKKRA